MNELKLVVPSYRRMPRQATLGFLPPSWMGNTYLVVDQHDYDLRNLYESQTRGATLLLHPPEITTIAKKRMWIIEHFRYHKIVMFDDDLRFSVRKNDGTTGLRQATVSDMERALERLVLLLDGYAHAGWSMRQGNNNVKDGGVLENARMCYTLGYDAELMWKMHTRGEIDLSGRVSCREDMDITLQLLKRGWPNGVDFDIAADQVTGFGAKGGCSEERTLESSDAAAELLAELHPGLVKVVTKSYAGSPDRKEVVVQWKKAFRSQCDDQNVETKRRDI